MFCARQIVKESAGLRVKRASPALRLSGASGAAAADPDPVEERRALQLRQSTRGMEERKAPDPDGNRP
ncbi:hypothetical protein MHYP_G00269870 [Metynnis hypsauchen]